MRLDDFDYRLPPSLIAQYPTARRGDSRLMVLGRGSGAIEHRSFSDLPDYLEPGDLLVTNDTRVIPARLIGKKVTGGKCEILLIPSRNRGNGTWEGLLKRAGRFKRGARLEFGEGLWGELEDLEAGKAKIRFQGEGDLIERLHRIGHVPLPPYIKREDEPLDRERYQTVFATRDGSIAAPTAGLHFTESLIRSLKGKGVGFASITLHVGIGTFAPVKAAEIEAHPMESEWIEISEGSAAEMESARKKGRRVVAVGTTTTRALESFSEAGERVRPGQGLSSLFIHPPYRFRAIDALITNFHLPKSTLIMLVSAFAGRDLILKAYAEAIEREYRFYSYGDAMLIL